MRVELNGVTIRYGTRVAVADANLTASPGEVLAVLGANGSGKSTLVRAVLGLNPLSGGSIELWGTPVARFHDW